jgi:hypothetical protein
MDEAAMDTLTLSSKALAVFAFALYHQLSSGEPVSGVIAADGAGHQADPDAVAELEAAGLARLEGGRINFTEAGLKRLATLLQDMERAAT